MRTLSSWKERPIPAKGTKDHERDAVGTILSAADLLWPVKHFEFCCNFVCPLLDSMFVGGAHKGLKQGMRLQGFRLKFRMELAADKVRVIGKFDDLDVGSIRSGAGDLDAASDERVFVFPIKLIAMTMALANFELVIGAVGQSAGHELTNPGSQPHRSPQFFHAP